MEDEFGPVNAIVRPEVYQECRAAIRLEPFLYIDGTLQKDGATYNVLARGVYPLRLSPELRLGRETVPAVEGEDETPDPFTYLEALRRDPPPTMSWGRGGGCR